MVELRTAAAARAPRSLTVALPPGYAIILRMSILEIENAIRQLPPEKVNELLGWLAEYHADIWDKEIAEDLEAGRLDTLLDEVDTEIGAGLAKPL